MRGYFLSVGCFFSSPVDGDSDGVGLCHADTERLTRNPILTPCDTAPVVVRRGGADDGTTARTLLTRSD